jgi:hypothetical protein
MWIAHSTDCDRLLQFQHMKEFRLCYVDGHFAYFTTKELSEQWGDDWNDAPYEHNAGKPYEWSGSDKAPKWEILKIAFEGSLRTPDSGVSNTPYSVQDINKGQVAWLENEPWEKTPVRIFAGATLDEFTRAIKSTDGKIYMAI